MRVWKARIDDGQASHRRPGTSPGAVTGIVTGARIPVVTGSADRKGIIAVRSAIRMGFLFTLANNDRTIQECPGTLTRNALVIIGADIAIVTRRIIDQGCPVSG